MAIKFSCDENAYVAYCRVSTAEQADEGAGLPAQRRAIAREAEYRELTIIEWCEDPGKSGKDLNRPGVTRALELIETGQARGLIVSKLDRLSRSLLDFATLMERARKGGWNLKALDLGIDLATPHGELMANVLATFAQFERRVIGQRTRDGLAEKRAAGVRLGRRGALSTETLNLIITLREQHLSYRAIATKLNEARVATPQGGKQWYASTVKGAYESIDASVLLQAM